MGERFLFLAIVYGLVIVGDGLKRMNSGTRKDRMVYIALMLATLYVSLDFLLNIRLPGLYDLADYFFGKTARQIDNMLKIPS